MGSCTTKFSNIVFLTGLVDERALCPHDFEFDSNQYAIYLKEHKFRARLINCEDFNEFICAYAFV